MKNYLKLILTLNNNKFSKWFFTATVVNISRKIMEQHFSEQNYAAGIFSDFDLGNGKEPECNDQADTIEDLRRVILFLVEERKLFMIKLRGLYALRRVLRDKCYMSVRDCDEIGGSLQEAVIRYNESPTGTVTKDPRLVEHLQRDCSRSCSQKDKQNIFKDSCREFHTGNEVS